MAEARFAGSKILLSCRSAQGFDSVAEAAKFPDHSISAVSSCLCTQRGTSLFVTQTAMENNPDQATKPMGDGPDSLIVSQTRYQSAVDDLKNGSFRLDRSVGSLIQNPPHVAVALRERWFFDTSALSSSPGHAPTHDERCLAEGNVAAPAPTSAMICFAESTPKPGISAKWTTASWCRLRRLANSWSSLTIC